MIEQELVQRVKKYLEKKEEKYYSNSLEYMGIRNTKQRDGSFKKMHLVHYMVSISDQQYYSDVFFTVAFDEKTLKMEFIVGPQSLEIIEE